MIFVFQVFFKQNVKLNTMLLFHFPHKQYQESSRALRTERKLKTETWYKNAVTITMVTATVFQSGKSILSFNYQSSLISAHEYGNKDSKD